MQIARVNVSRRLSADPPKSVTVGDAAMLCSLAYRRARSLRTERAILAPLGLNSNTYISRQKEMEPQLVRQIAADLINFQIPTVETIVTGIDPLGPHIFVVNDGDVHCLDTVGFASIGVGRWHANSQFMFSGHVRTKPLAETLLLVYAAKRRAEVAPGVGQGTDMFSIGASEGSYFKIGNNILVNLRTIYSRTRKKNEAAIRKANEEVNHYVDGLLAAGTTATEQAKEAEEARVAGQQALEQPAEPEPPAPAEAIEPELPAPEPEEG